MSDLRGVEGPSSLVHHGNSPDRNMANAYEAIQHTKQLSQSFGSLLFSKELSDISFRVEDEEIPAHKVVLAARSTYFKAMLFGGMREGRERVVELKEVSLPAFKLLLQYIYTGCVSLASVKEDSIVDLLGLANQWNFTALQEAIADYLKMALTTRNLCVFFNVAQLYNLSSLVEACFQYADWNASQLITLSSFQALSASAMESLIIRDSFCAPEIDIFNAVLKWSQSHPSESSSLPSILKCIRLPLISIGELLSTVRDSSLLHPDELLDAINEQQKKSSVDLRHRGLLVINSNILTASNATVICGKSPQALLMAPETSAVMDCERIFTNHTIGEDEGGIVIELAQPYIINMITLRLWDKEPKMYSYYIQVSKDNVSWVTLVDYSKYLCRSWQSLHFPSRTVKYIRIVGTLNTQSRVFHLVQMEASFSTENVHFDPVSMLMIPSHNMATISRHALVIEGVSRLRNALLNGDTTEYDWDNGYTCHQLNSGSITVQMPQPFLVSSIRLLLWDCDDRFYSYYVEVSVNQQSWKRVADRTNEQCRAWQLLQFPPEPVVFIRIVGTFNSANEVFHCVHLECPAEPRDEDLPKMEQLAVEEVEDAD